MKTDWVKDRSSEKPSEFQKANFKEWIQRKNITEETDENGNTFWTSDLRFVSNDVYEELQDMKDITNYILQTTQPFQEYYEGYKAALELLGEETAL